MFRTLCLLVLVACQAQIGGIEADIGPDAAVQQRPDAAESQPDAAAIVDNECGVASSQGDLGSLIGTVGVGAQDGTGTQVHAVSAVTPQSAMQTTPDVVLVELWDGYGVFAGGAARTGTFAITGDETKYDTCGVCVLVLANVANDVPTKLLLATAGTVTVSSIAAAAGQTTQVTVTDASFVEIALVADQGYQPVGSTCPSPISRGELRGTL